MFDIFVFFQSSFCISFRECRHRQKKKKGGKTPFLLLLRALWNTNEKRKENTNYSAPRPQNKGCLSGAHDIREAAGAMSACARTDASGGEPCGIHTCGSWPRMQSIAAD